MLKLEELCARNWVQYEGKPMQIGSFMGAFALFVDNEVYYADLEPLPITPETLALLGFVYEDSNKWYVLLANKNVQVFLSKRDVWVLTSNRLIIDVESIHRMQNIMQSLYGITLTPTKP